MHTTQPIVRRRRIVRAIEDLRQREQTPPVRKLIRRLMIEMNAMDAGQRELADCLQRTFDWLNRLDTPEALLAEIRQDPINEYDNKPLLNNLGIAKRILRLRQLAGGQFTDLSQLQNLGPNIDVIVDDLLFTGAIQESAPPPALNPGNGVLLPVRLETRFYPPNGGNWIMRVLVVPDEPSFDRHDPIPTASELDSVEKLWQTATGGLGTAEGKVAWQQFAARHGAARAAWLARSFPPLPPDANGVIHVNRPAEVREEPRVNHIRGFPEEIELWMARGGGAPVMVAQNNVLVDRLRLDFPDPEDANDRRWWNSWVEAKDVGLGFELDMGPGVPGDIDVLYVVGLGKESPGPLFETHRDRGALGLIKPGTPTNTVDGDPAADLARDPEIWRQIAVDPTNVGLGSREVSQALTGKPDLLGALPGDTFAHRETAHQLVQALWMPLWGHAFKDHWGLGRDVDLAGLWAGLFLAPEGPLPPIRIGDQPYGLLPVTALKGFQPSTKNPDFARLEGNLLPWLKRAHKMWAQLAEAEGNITDADTERLLELVGRTPTSNAYSYRLFLSLELLNLLYYAYKTGMDNQALLEWWGETSQELKQFNLEAVRPYTSIGWPQDLQIPLVAPADVPPDVPFFDFLATFIDPAELLDAHLERWIGPRDGRPYNELPDSLLARLLLLARIFVSAEVHRAANGQNGPILEPIGTNINNTTRLARDAMAMSDNDLGNGGFATELFKQFTEASHTIMKIPVGELDRVMRAVLDTAIYRIDPWITAFAWRRLKESSASGLPFHLGIYGWVDAPRPGTPGPTEGGLLHAPSEPQALAAAILRDKAIHDPQPGRWDMNLESSTVRLAQRIAEEVRLGAHVSEVLGREVERIAATKAAVDRLRKDFPLRTEHAGRRVCDGMTVLKADPTTLQLNAGQLAELDALRRALDTYGDLLVAEAVYHVVSGRGAVAGAAMEAAAGLGAPPNLEVISTQRTGRSVNTNVVVLLPNAPDPAASSPTTSPGQIAEPAVAAFLSSTFGATNVAPWRWPVLLPETTPGSRTQDIFLSDTGLSVIDTIALSSEDLVRLVLSKAPNGALLNTEWQLRHPDGTLHTARLSDLNLNLSEILHLTEVDLQKLVLESAPADSAVLGILPPQGSEAQRQARRMNEILGRQPAVPADLVDTGLIPADASVCAELRGRYDRLRTVAGLMKTKLDAVVAGTDATSPEDALIMAARWGIVPLVRVEDTVLTRVQHAAQALQERISRSPLPADILNEDAPRLAAIISELASPEGKLAILSRIPFSGWPTAFTAQPELDDEWLTVNAAVREPLARLEAHQMDDLLAGSGAAFDAWINRPGDPWQVTVPASITGAKPPTRLVALYGTPGILPASWPADTTTLPTVAAGLLDSWGETVPDVDQATTAAFGFNAPASRAPQAILIAVPPVEDEPLSVPVLVDILVETRQLARARMVPPARLNRLAAGLPTIMIPGSGVTGMPLEPNP